MRSATAISPGRESGWQPCLPAGPIPTSATRQRDSSGHWSTAGKGGLSRFRPRPKRPQDPWRHRSPSADPRARGHHADTWDPRDNADPDDLGPGLHALAGRSSSRLPPGREAARPQPSPPPSAPRCLPTPPRGRDDSRAPGGAPAAPRRDPFVARGSPAGDLRRAPPTDSGGERAAAGLRSRLFLAGGAARRRGGRWRPPGRAAGSRQRAGREAWPRRVPRPPLLVSRHGAGAGRSGRDPRDPRRARSAGASFSQLSCWVASRSYATSAQTR